MRLVTRVHEWLADRIPGVQYPHIRPADAYTRAAQRNPLSAPMRVLLALAGSAAVVLGLLLMAAAAFVLWAVIGS